MHEDRVMVNERLRRCMLRAGLGSEALAEAAQVSTKTVEWWLRGEVMPYPRTRYRVAAILQEDESYLWPGVIDRAALTGAEMVTGDVGCFVCGGEVPAGGGRRRSGRPRSWRPR
jgi:transcriptional regulator with XRE-family HTH domain